MYESILAIPHAIHKNGVPHSISKNNPIVDCHGRSGFQTRIKLFTNKPDFNLRTKLIKY